MSTVQSASSAAFSGASGTSVPLLDLHAQFVTIEEQIHAAISRVLKSQHFILGAEVQALEMEIAAFVGAESAIGVSSGTDALLVSLMALDIRPGDEIITTPFSFFATGGVIARVGATPVFVDIDPATFNIDPSEVEKHITDRTRAIIPVHLFGRMADMAGLREAIGDRRIAVVEDAAQALGSSDEQGRSAGTLGDIGCFSFFPSKNLGCCGDGGMVTTNNPGMADRLLTLRVHGSKPKYYHKMIGGNFRLDALQAAILRVKLPHLDNWTASRRANAERYRDMFRAAGIEDDVILPRDVRGHCYNQFVIRVHNRDALQVHLKANGVTTEIYYPLPLHLQECFASLGYKEGDLPHAEDAARQVLALPIYPELSKAQQQHVVDVIVDFVGGRR